MVDILITILGVALLVLVWIMLYDSNRFVVSVHVVTDSGGRIRKPCRAVVLADLHNKCYGRDNERLLAAIREYCPDMILVAGDIPTAKPGAALDVAIRLMEELSRDYPVYYANGNHEHRMKLYPEVYGGMGEAYGRALEEMGVCRLVNAHIDLPEYGLALYGAEIDRFYYKRFGVQKMEDSYLSSTLGKPSPAMFNVLLAHNPDYFPQYARWGADLVLSGHVHGGMVRVPFWNRGVVSPNIRLFPRYDGGDFQEGQARMLVSRGLGMHTIPIRLFNPGELLVLDFQPLKPEFLPEAKQGIQRE